MDQISDPSILERERLDEPEARPRRRRWKATALGAAAAAPTPISVVTVSQPLQREVDVRAGFLGQFSAIDRVELRAQVGGTLTEIHFKDGQIVHKGDLL